ncbi:PREDICTED: uncharacterized protein LOC104757938 [Camelina sativa]|uniref:Uncharacterized protein LOC104757938 n=1 Tax=Camelina sativa TaxID=90675 RepID=A0ABM0X109_CAMSA|nr:PREDICTED: uncharacterized protein LOC104757938 [Camelina sativa]
MVNHEIIVRVLSEKVSGSSGKLKIKVPRFDNSALIQGYAKTLIGRCMNPAMQDMKALLFMLPKIWKIEERVVGADLGMGRFQFDFDQEEDILEVLKMEPYHFDHWMLSLVRWEPVVDHMYPYLIKFWVRMMGVPLHFWADETFRSIGSDLGEVVEVDIDNGRVQFLFDGFKPLVFEAAVEFHSGEETLVILRYERLYGYCRWCFRLCHDVSYCPLFGNNGKQAQASGTDPRPEDKLQSYKGAVASGSNSGSSSGVRGSGAPQGSAVGGGRGAGGGQADGHRHKQGFGHKSKRGRRDFQPKEQVAQQASMAGTTVPVVGEGVGPAQGTDGDVTEQPILDAFLDSATEEVAVPLFVEVPSGEDKRVCKNLFLLL